MFRRGISLFVVSTMLITGFIGCSKKNEAVVDSQKTVDQKEKYLKPVTINAVRSTKEIIANKEDIRKEKLKEKFNIDWVFTEIPQNDFKVKLTMLFAAGESPDVLDNIRPEWGLDEFTQAGYLKGFTKDEIKKLTPNYLKLFSDEEYNYVYNATRNSDDKVYYLVGKRPQKVRMTWEYRKDLFDKYNLSFPKTPDEFLNVCKVLRDKEGKTPYLPANPGGSTPLFVFSGVYMMYGLPELIVRDMSYVDPKTKQFVPYAFTEDNMRQALILLNKMWKENLLWKEFVSGTEEQLKKFRSAGNGSIMWAYPDRAAEYNNYVKDSAPNANWTWSKDMISADPEKIIYKREPYEQPDGRALTTKASAEVQSRYLDYLDWACTDEGLAFHTFGIEGKTAQKKDGKWMLADKMQSTLNPGGERFGLYATGGIGGYNGAWITTHPDYETVYNPIFKEVANNFIDRPKHYSFIAPIYQYTAGEKSKLADLTTNISSINNEYCLKFIMNQYDPNNDSDWKKFKEALDKVGLKDFIKIRTDAYNRANGTK